LGGEWEVKDEKGYERFLLSHFVRTSGGATGQQELRYAEIGSGWALLCWCDLPLLMTKFDGL
jgi:hypothetical protein